MRRIALVVALVLGLVLPVLAGTTRYNFNYTNNDNENSNLDKLDARMPGSDAATFVTYCGQQANATTAFLGAVGDANLFNIDKFARVVGDATCDGYGSGTEATADKTISADIPLKWTGFSCVIEAALSGAAATSTFSSEINAGASTPLMTCTITGTVPRMCQATTTNPPIIPAGQAITIKNVTSGNESANGALCYLYLQPAP